nr:TPA_asm: adenain [Megastigmus wasp adintovirus]
MRNALPIGGPLHNECAIINLDDNTGPGTHWVAYRKNGKNVLYFDSFGDLRPPIDLINYFNINQIKYNYKIYQEYNTFICGHLCLKFLNNLLDHPDNFHLYKEV